MCRGQAGACSDGFLFRLVRLRDKAGAGWGGLLIFVAVYTVSPNVFGGLRVYIRGPGHRLFVLTFR